MSASGASAAIKAVEKLKKPAKKPAKTPAGSSARTKKSVIGVAKKKSVVGVAKEQRRQKAYSLCASFKSKRTKERLVYMEWFTAEPPGAGNNEFVDAVSRTLTHMHGGAETRLGSDAECTAHNVALVS